MGHQGRRRALLVGCVYPGSKAELRGCANDVQAEKEMLQTVFKFTDNEIQVMLDTDPTTERPTGANLRRRFSQLTRWAGPGDTVYIHFSGHGVQIPCQYDMEEDDLDEALVPSDMNVIIDDDLRFIFQHMDPQAKLYFVVDCCHSGSMLDHPKSLVQTRRNKSEDLPLYTSLSHEPPLKKYQSTSSFSWVNEQGVHHINRGLSLEAFADMLGSQTNQHVRVDNVHQALYKSFGKHSSFKIKEGFKKSQKSFKVKDVVQPRLWWFTKNKSSIANSRKSAHNQSITNQNQKQSSGWDLSRNLFNFGIFRQSSRIQDQSFQQGILVAGCQDFETSADVAPGGKKDQAYGALTHCLTTIVKNHYLNSPVSDQVVPLTNQQLVLKIRAMLEQMGFQQNPSLECSDDDASSYFLQ